MTEETNVGPRRGGRGVTSHGGVGLLACMYIYVGRELYSGEVHRIEMERSGRYTDGERVA